MRYAAPVSVYQVNRLIYAMKMDGALAERYRSDRTALLGEWDLSERERSALGDLDFGWLREAGVMPNLLLKLTSIAQVPLSRLTEQTTTEHETE
jgi:hypothetical protein